MLPIVRWQLTILKCCCYSLLTNHSNELLTIDNGKPISKINSPLSYQITIPMLFAIHKIPRILHWRRKSLIGVFSLLSSVKKYHLLIVIEINNVIIFKIGAKKNKKKKQEYMYIVCIKCKDDDDLCSEEKNLLENRGKCVVIQNRDCFAFIIVKWIFNQLDIIITISQCHFNYYTM